METLMSSGEEQEKVGIIKPDHAMGFNQTLRALWTQILFKVVIFIAFILINDLVEKFTGQKLVKIQLWRPQPKTTEDLPFTGPPIFFVEPSPTKTQFRLTEACAIEAAARAHPQSLVFIYANNPWIIDTNLSTVPLPSNRNIIYRVLNVSDVFRDTPYQERTSWYESLSQDDHKLFENALRTSLLYKHGGISLSTDTLTLRDMSQVRNAVPAQNANLLGEGVFIFDQHHWFLQALIQEILSYNMTMKEVTVDPLDKAFAKVCGGKDALLDFIYLPDACDGLLVMPPYLFYPLVRKKWYLNLERLTDTRRDLWSQSFAVYLWNSDQFDQTVLSGSGVLMDVLARMACPELHILGVIQQLTY